MGILSAIFNTKYSKYPMFLQYVDCTHRVTGADYYKVRELLKPGDIILRGHDNYLSKFLVPGEYSHSGIYKGNDVVIHSTVENGVHESNLVDFMRCDRFMALRPSLCQNLIIENAQKYIGKKYDNELEDNDDEYYCHEFVASVLKDCSFEINKIHASTLFGLISKDIYCAQSFLNNIIFNKVVEIDWKKTKKNPHPLTCEM